MFGRRIAIVAAMAALGAAGCIGHADPPWNPTDSTAPELGSTGPITGCTNVALDECETLASLVRAKLPPARDGSVVAIELELYGCPGAIDDEPPPSCPPSLDSRSGQVTVDFDDDRGPVQFSLAGPADAPQIEPLDTCPFSDDPGGMCWRLMKATSDPVTGSGPFPYAVDHCGLAHVVDFDGSFWVVTGRVDGSPFMGMQEQGEMRLLGPNLAEYRQATRDGPFVARLARFPGPKFIWQWCA